LLLLVAQANREKDPVLEVLQIAPWGHVKAANEQALLGQAIKGDEMVNQLTGNCATERTIDLSLNFLPR
jgi:hypothetical protein